MVGPQLYPRLVGLYVNHFNICWLDMSKENSPSALPFMQGVFWQATGLVCLSKHLEISQSHYSREQGKVQFPLGQFQFPEGLLGFLTCTQSFIWWPNTEAALGLRGCLSF